MRPKILFILHLPPPVHGAAVVGQYIHNSKTINEVFDCHYLNLTLARDINDIGKGGVRKMRDFLRLLDRIRRTVKVLNPDLCYVTPNAKGGAFYKDFVVVQMLKIMGCKIVIHFHNKGVETRQNCVLDNYLYSRFFKDLKVILLAKELYADIKKYVPVDNVYICPNGIPLAGACKRQKMYRDIPRILFLSNMISSKGVWVLIEACQILRKQGITFHCDFVGKWSDITEESFNVAISEKGLEGVVCAYGAKYGDEKLAFFNQADVFVFPTYYDNECFPIVLLEAMQMGLPCVSTNEGGISSIVEDGKTGFIVEKKNSEALADRIAYLLGHPTVCKEMGENGRKRFNEKYTLEIFESRIKNILSECITKTTQS